MRMHIPVMSPCAQHALFLLKPSSRVLPAFAPARMRAWILPHPVHPVYKKPPHQCDPPAHNANAEPKPLISRIGTNTDERVNRELRQWECKCTARVEVTHNSRHSRNSRLTLFRSQIIFWLHLWYISRFAVAFKQFMAQSRSRISKYLVLRYVC